MNFLAGIIVQLLKWVLPLGVHALVQAFQDYMAKKKQDKQDASQNQDFQKVVHDPTATREDRKNAEDNAFN